MNINNKTFEAKVNGNILYYDLCDVLKQKYDMIPVYAYTELLVAKCRQEGILSEIEYMLETYNEEVNKPFFTVVYKVSPRIYTDLFPPETNKRMIMHSREVYKRILFVKQSFFSYMLLCGFCDLMDKTCPHEVILKGDL